MRTRKKPRKAKIGKSGYVRSMTEKEIDVKVEKERLEEIAEGRKQT